MVAAVGLLEDPSALVLLVGDGPERKGLEKEAKRIGVDDRLRFEGFVAHEQLPALLAHADLLVLPSSTRSWGPCHWKRCRPVYPSSPPRPAASRR